MAIYQYIPWPAERSIYFSKGGGLRQVFSAALEFTLSNRLPMNSEIYSAFWVLGFKACAITPCQKAGIIQRLITLVSPKDISVRAKLFFFLSLFVCVFPSFSFLTFIFIEDFHIYYVLRPLSNFILLLLLLFWCLVAFAFLF